MNKKNICFFIGSFQAGGAENHVLQTIRNINKNKFNCTLAVVDNSGMYKKEFNELNIPIYTSNSLKNQYLWSFLWIVKILPFVRFLINNRIEIIHIHLIGSYPFALLAAMIAKIPIKIITWHNIYDNSVINYSIKRPQTIIHYIKIFSAVKMGSIYANKIIAVSTKVKNSNCNFYKINPKKVSVVYNGINKIEFCKQQYETSNKKFIIGAVGTLQKQKNYLDMLKAMKMIIQSNPNVELNIMGDGLLKNDLLQFIHKNNLERNVFLLGNRNDIPLQLSKLDLWLMSSLHEGFSIALLEAMAVGLPIIATAVGGNSEAIENEKSGLLIQPQSITEIVNSVIRLVDNIDLRKKIGKNAQNRFHHNFTSKIMMKSLDTLYSND